MHEQAIQHFKYADPILDYVIGKVGALDYTPESDGFAFLVQVIIGQMLSAKAADTIHSRLLAKVDGTVTPTAVAMLEEDSLRSLGIARRKAQTILALAQQLIQDPQVLDDLASLDDRQCLACLCRYKGIGPWTAKMYLIFVLDRPDVLPLEDGAFLQAYRFLYGDADIETRASVWKPYRSLAARYLYRFLDLGYCR
jgi:DNA-3-methyladenine glycosylase II